ncbi:MAG: S41 family peptidase [Bacteroidales bacterium]|jgi:carboxyl-terminal processing protease|nr:S41 family peptidase [Bacteroidales bacterium]MDI9576133.1 S41 family peptidase [Bacteroidota bacterium]MDD3754821.1 S41 family peptidase [Bacteroidales bacterium]MDY0400139.1 S41 family peptidase [Bacteroidales bacterium]HHW60050.1 S41 family peptidase [Bacteroidales bacterium]
MKKIIVFIIIFYFSTFIYSQKNTVNIEPVNDIISTQVQKFSQLLNLLDRYYVDTVNFSHLTEEAIKGLLSELDPHSVYIPAKDVKSVEEPLVGSFEGIGITFQIIRDTINVIEVISGGPAEIVGIFPGDKIIKIDDSVAYGSYVTNDYVTKKLRGPKGTSVKVTIKRVNHSELIDFIIIRDKIPLNSINAAYMLEPGIAYIKVDRFARNTINEFKNTINELKKEKIDFLILDLRGNGGGYLSTAVQLADEFLDAGKLIVYTQGRSMPVNKYASSAKGEYQDGKLIVLIDERSASASEIVAGAMQDWDRAILMGRRSFGKGLVQNPYYLLDGSLVRLTIAKYYTPTGRCIQKPYSNSNEYYHDIENRLKKGELMHPDSVHLPDSLKYYTLNKNRLVYGGGGIMPDVFIPLDTSLSSELSNQLVRKNIYNMYVIDIISKEREKLLNSYPTKEVFRKKFIIYDDLFNNFLNYAKNNEIEINNDELERSKSIINCVLKASIARYLYGVSGYYYNIYEIDYELKKAVELGKDGKVFEQLY